MEKAYCDTPLGTAVIKGDEAGISRLEITSKAGHSQTPMHLEKAVHQLHDYFYGKRTSFELLLNPAGTPFQRKVWDLLQDIDYGHTCTYSKLALKLGNRHAIRAVAAANAKNPLWILIPCHRIIGLDGSLTGYAGGIWRKKWLLEHEHPDKQQSLELEI